MRSFKTVLTVIGAVTVLLLAGNTLASAATGGKFTLGKINKANKISVLKRTTAGPPLKLTTTSSAAAPMVVNGRGKIANLNADRVDGYDGSQMLNKALVYERGISAGPATQFIVTLANVPAGKYVFNSAGFIYTLTTNGHACVLKVPSTGRQLYEWFPADTSGGFIMPNGSGFVTVPTTQDLTYRCYDNGGASNSWSSLPSQPLQLILTPIASTSSSTPAVARVSGSRVASGATR